MLVQVLIGIIFILCAWFNRNRQKNEPPVCSGGKMFIGHALQFVGNSTKLWKFIQEVNREAQDRGGVLKMTIGPKSLYVVTNPEDCLTVSKACLQKDVTYSFSKPWYGDGLLTSSGKMLVQVLICIIFILCAWFNRNRQKNEPPVCSGGKMFIGHALQFVGNSTKLWKFIQEVNREAQDRGGVLKMTIGPKSLYVVTNPEDCLTVSKACLQKDVTYSFSKPWYGDGLLTSGATKWKVQRKLLNPAFSQHVLDSFLNIFNNKSRCFVENLKIEVGERPFDHWEYAKQISFETVCLTTMGMDFKEKNEANTEFIAAVDKILHIFIGRFQSLWLHNNFLFGLSSLKRKQDNCIKILHRMSNSILKQRKESFMNNLANGILEDKAKSPKFKTFMELLLELAYVSNVFTDREIREHVDTMIGAGLDTISIAIMNSMLLIGSYPKVQEKIREELKNIFDDADRDVTKLDLPQLVYLEAVIKESLRFYPPGPIIGRHLDKDVKLRNCTLYKGNSVYLLIYGINRHSMWGQDVEEFRPERWLELSTQPDPTCIASFGFGRRNCIAKAYTMMSMKVTLAHVCRKYLIRGDHTKIQFKLDILLKPVSGHYITIEKRK